MIHTKEMLAILMTFVEQCGHLKVFPFDKRLAGRGTSSHLTQDNLWATNKAMGQLK